MTMPTLPSLGGLKSGVQTSEFWLVILGFVADGAVAFLHVDLTRYVPLAAVVLAHVIAALYVIGRIILKLRWPSSLVTAKSDIHLLADAEAAVKAAVADVEAHKDEIVALAAAVKADVAKARKPAPKAPAA